MNPIGFAYSPPTVNGELAGVLEWSKPGGVIVTGRGNRMHSTFQKSRGLGIELWAYWNCVEAPDNLSNEQEAWQYKLADGSAPPPWPYKDANNQVRRQWPGNYLLDIRPGSPWLKHIIPKTVELVDLRKHDGLFLDTIGARPWGKLVAWDTWPVKEQAEWVACQVNLAREIAAAVGGRVKLVHNNLWANVLKSDHPAYSIAPNGEKYCNGVSLENPAGNMPSDFHKAYAGRTFGLLPRRVPVTDSTDADTIAWSKVPGVTHVCSVEKAIGETYARLTPPVVPYTGKDEAEDEAENEALRLRVAELTAENTALKAANAELQSKVGELQAIDEGQEERFAEIHRLSQPMT